MLQIGDGLHTHNIKEQLLTSQLCKQPMKAYEAKTKMIASVRKKGTEIYTQALSNNLLAVRMYVHTYICTLGREQRAFMSIHSSSRLTRVVTIGGFREGGREEGEREGRREGGKEEGRKGEREGGREGEREGRRSGRAHV